MSTVTKLRRREDPEVRSREILNEAVRLIGERGCNGFTVDELARRCAISKGGLLHHFETKDSLLLAIIDEAERSEKEALTPLLKAALGSGGNEPSRDAVLTFLRAVFARSNSDPNICRLYVRLKAEAIDPAHLAHASIRRRDTATLEVFTRVLAPFTQNPSSAARRLMAMQDGLTLQSLLAEAPYDPFQEWMQAVEQFLPSEKPRSAREVPPASTPRTRP